MGSRLRLLLIALVAGGVSVAAASSATPLPKLASATMVGDRVDLVFTGALRPRTGS